VAASKKTCPKPRSDGLPTKVFFSEEKKQKTFGPSLNWFRNVQLKSQNALRSALAICNKLARESFNPL
jgi:hypothetical protein